MVMPKVYVETYGCWLNKAESEVMVTILSRLGYEVCSSVDEANLIIVNTCAVRSETESRILKRLSELRRILEGRNCRVVVCGCLARVRPASILEVFPDAILLDPNSIERISEVLSLEPGSFVFSDVPTREVLPEFRGGLRYVVPIATGCRGNCSFCIDKVARRVVRSYDKSLIVERVRRAVERGAREIFLTAQDAAVYGIDRGYTLVELLEAIDRIEGRFFVRVGMMEPSEVMRILDGLLDVFKRSEKLYRFFHIPLQSGDDRVLKLMNRRYSVAEYVELIRRIRRELPDASIVTDIIVGFPGEDEEAFENTCKVVRELKFDKVHVARYTPRPFTLGSTMKQVPEPIKKCRSRVLTIVANEVALEINMRLVGSRVEVLVTGEGQSEKGFIGSRTRSYKLTFLKEARVGEFAEVYVERATPLYLYGSVVRYVH